MVHYLAAGCPVDPGELLLSREQRGNRLKELAGRYPDATLVSFTLNIPGPIKSNGAIDLVFRVGLALIQKALKEYQTVFEAHGSTGPEVVLAVALDGRQVKEAMVGLEEKDPLGRLFDIDVLVQGRALGREDLGLPPRCCLICSRPARLCARAARHPLPELRAAMERLLLEDPRIRAGLEKIRESPPLR